MAESLPKIDNTDLNDSVGQLIKRQDITNTSLLSIKDVLEKNLVIEKKSLDADKKETRSFKDMVTGLLFKQKEKDKEAAKVTPVNDNNEEKPRTKLSDAFKGDKGFLSKILGPLAAGALAYFVMNPDSIVKVFDFIKGVVDWFSGTKDIITGLGETADGIMNSDLMKGLAATAAALSASLLLFPRTTIGLFKLATGAVNSSIAMANKAAAKVKSVLPSKGGTATTTATKPATVPKPAAATTAPKPATATTAPKPAATVAAKPATSAATAIGKTAASAGTAATAVSTPAAASASQVPANENVKPAQPAKPAMTKSGYKVGEVFETKSGGKMKVMQNAKTGAIFTQGVAKSTKVGMQKVNPLTKFPKFAKVLGVAKRIPVLGTVLGAAEVLSILASDASMEDKVAGVAGALGGIGGSALGAMMGGTLGTAIFPGVGTAIGGALGGFGGYFLASSMTKALAQWMLGQKVDAFPLDFLNNLMNGDETPQTGTGTGEPAPQVSKKEVKPPAATKEQVETIPGKTGLPKKLSDLVLDGRKYDPELPAHQLRARTLGYNPETGLHMSDPEYEKAKAMARTSSKPLAANQNTDGFKADAMSREQKDANVTIVNAPTNNVSAPQNNSTNISSSGGGGSNPIEPKNSDYSLSGAV
tara:strand:+ start:2386 stop:4320 length:1935 start_codon:yes stop_codon:yes gene_type:complete